MEDGREMKSSAIAVLRKRYEEQRAQVAGIDDRMTEYFDELCEHSSSVPDDPDDRHNVYEVLGAVRFLRLLRTYEFNHEKVRMVIRLREGDWEKNGNTWRHLSGGLAQPGTGGAKVYRWAPFQVFVLAYVFGFYAWVDTELTEDDRELLETEKLEDDDSGSAAVYSPGKKGRRILDYRRLCTEFTYFGPRKTDKTGLSAYLQVVFFLLEDYNSEGYCLANSADQAKLLYRRAKLMLQQLDDGHRMRMTETVCDWRPAFKNVRDSSIRPLSAGGKTKDGMFALLFSADEFGSASTINGKSDMKMLIDVVRSSMGPRREPLGFFTTTAGRIQHGPFIEMLDGLHRMLEAELVYDSGEAVAPISDDRTSCLLLEPDVWERDEEFLLTNRNVRRKVNPMLGKIVQHQFYDDEIAKARRNGDTAEVISKLFNVYQSNTIRDWIKADEIRSIQVPMRIDDCKAADGWAVFCGMDFSKGDDLNGNGYLAVNMRTREFFIDTDIWVSEKAVTESPIRELYERWAEDGWLHIVPGQTFDPAVVVNRIGELTRIGVDIWRFGYDPYNAAIVVNALAAFIADLGREPSHHIMVVRQNYATYNSVVVEFDYMLHRCDQSGKPWPMVHASMNPMLPWQFSNAVLDVDPRNDNKKPIKKTPGSEACKVDSVQMILSALWCYDQVDGGKVEE